MTSICMVWC